jgi:hypothetical protein
MSHEQQQAQTQEQQYNTEYVKFIKTFIANKCYIKYCLQNCTFKTPTSWAVMNEQNDTNCELEMSKMSNNCITISQTNNIEEFHRIQLMENKNNEDLWNKIMNEMHIPIKYLTLLYKTTTYGIPIHNINVFKQQTFQEYIDSLISLKTVGNYEYQRFIKSMQDESFKKKMIDKYNESIYTNVIKNYIIYVVQLYLARTTNSSTIFTDEEYEEMDISIDLIPYVEFLSKKKLSIDNFRYYQEEEIEEKQYIKKNSIEELYNENLELETIKFINNSLYK